MQSSSYQYKRLTGSSKEDVKAPSIAMFRNNLSALSQYRNLLFVAYVDEVYVYTPGFPEQTIAIKPELVIDLPRSRPDLRGYLDPSRPHAVNHLIVGDIGNEEILVVACDDGDVISYTVRSICLAIDEGAKTVFAPDPYEDHKLKRYRQSGWINLILPVVDPHRTPGFRVLAAWFHENVGASAWGLATHKRAKLLAVSSNTKEINIFAPALWQDSLSERQGNGNMDWNRAFHSPSASETMERYTTWWTRKLIAQRDRSLGRKVTLSGHVAHIPNIAFFDNDLDPDGSYLASTDIDGCTLIWDIWGHAPILESSANAWPNVRGWGVACLDPQTSRLSEGPINTFGCACCVDGSSAVIDNLQAGELVHNNSQWHPGDSALGSVPGLLPTGMITPALQTPIQTAAATSADQNLETEDEAEVDEEMDEIDNLDAAFDEDALDEGEEADAPASEEALLVDIFGVNVPSQLAQILDAVEVEQLLSDENSAWEDEDYHLPDLEELSVAEQTDQQTSEAAAEEDLKTLSPGFKKHIDRISDTANAKILRGLINLPFNLLQTDERDIHLFGDIRFDADPKCPPFPSHSHVLCQQALNQRMPPGFEDLFQMERLNMIAQIPELGVVLIGNQVGRVGILTMIRWEAQKHSGYKVECILPSSSEEGKGLRPRKPLMGMAVGPVQGQEKALPQDSPRMGAGHPRRFRLLMTYCDHTILSYEISRPNGEESLLVV
ncbi:MAG: hypothetical protein ASARMPREDX12_009120 [Alectoria sarmentosa]|nr:MAG: hypothetical protein ASARMPREDX12_009120 [Alectoria sarmentosa]